MNRVQAIGKVHICVFGKVVFWETETLNKMYSAKED